MAKVISKPNGRRHPKYLLIGFQTVLFDEVPTDLRRATLKLEGARQLTMCKEAQRLARAK